MEQKMRLLWFNVALMLACIAPVLTATGDFENVRDKTRKEESVKEFQKKMTDLTLLHFTTSLDYLFTGAEYANQKMEKPGMAKYLRKLSDTHWKEAIDMLKKHFKRSGTTALFHDNPFSVHGKSEFDRSADSTYMQTLNELHKDSKIFTNHMNELHKLSAKHLNDGDWQHYFEKKLEEEEERKRELKGHITTLEPMSGMGLAVQLFDSNL